MSSSAKPQKDDARHASSRPTSSTPTSRQAGSRSQQRKGAPSTASGKAEVGRMDKENFPTPGRSRESQYPRDTLGDTTSRGGKKALSNPVDQQHDAVAARRKSGSVESSSQNPSATPSAWSRYPQSVSDVTKSAPDQDHKTNEKSRPRTSQQKIQQVQPDSAISRDHQPDPRVTGARQKSYYVADTGKSDFDGKSKERREDQDRRQISREVSQKDQRPVHDKKKRKTAVYQETLEDLEGRLRSSNLKRSDVQRRVDVVNLLIDGLLDYLNNEVSSGGKKWRSLNSGSYFDHTKISKPDEFDIMLTCSFRVRTIYASSGPEKLFCKLQAIESEYQTNPLECFHEDRHDGKIYACPKSFKKNFRLHCEKFIKKHRQRGTIIELTKYDTVSPAVTLNINAEGIKFAVDLVPSISLEEWPQPAKTWTSRWLRKADVNRIKAEGGEWPNEFPCAVSKIFPSESRKKPGECRLWRISFSPIEKKIFLHSDGTLKSPKEGPTIRKGVLRLLKEKVSQFNQLAVSSTADSKFSSHFLKNIMLQLYDDVSGWEEADLLDRYLDGLDAVVSCLKARQIPHYFICGVNLLDPQLAHLTGEKLKYYEESFANEAKDLRSQAGLA